MSLVNLCVTKVYCLTKRRRRRPDTRWQPVFAEQIRGMQLGDVSMPVKTTAGWHLLKLNDDAAALEEIVGQVQLQKTFEKIIAETRERLHVEVRREPPGK